MTVPVLAVVSADSHGATVTVDGQRYRVPAREVVRALETMEATCYGTHRIGRGPRLSLAQWLTIREAIGDASVRRAG